MINLLPDSSKKQIRSARMNVNLISYIITLCFAVIFLSLVCFISYLILNDSKTAAEKIITNNQSTSSAINSPLDSQIGTMNTNFSVAKNIFGKQISYSNIIMSLGSVMPSGVVIDSLSFDSNTISSSITIKARAKSSENVTTLKSNLQSSTLFSNSNVGNISNSQTDTTGYPAEFSIVLTIRGALK